MNTGTNNNNEDIEDSTINSNNNNNFEPEETEVPIVGLIKSEQLDDFETHLQIEQSDPKSPLYSSKTFEELDLKPELLKGIYAMGFNRPSKIQETALPTIIKSPNNLIAQSQSGTGKTAAFTLGMLNAVDQNLNEPQVICICPTHELALQIYGVICKIGQFTTIKPILCIPDHPLPSRFQSPIIIGTPGKILDQMSNRKLATHHIKMLVLDEADFLISMRNLSSQVLKIQKFLPKKLKTVLFSATFSVGVDKIIERFVPEPRTRLSLKKKELSVEKILQYYIDCKSPENKPVILSECFGHISVGQAIIFTHTKFTCRNLTDKMLNEGYPVSMLHGEMSIEDRFKSIQDFKDGKTKILVTTNVLSRGIDILQVSLVINYDLPLDENGKPDPVLYLHRVGRVGRFGRSGVAISFAHDDLSIRQIQSISQHLDHPINELKDDEIKTLSDVLKNLKDLTPKLTPSTTTTTTTTTTN